MSYNYRAKILDMARYNTRVKIFMPHRALSRAERSAISLKNGTAQVPALHGAAS
jgi:hypothetical protein